MKLAVYVFPTIMLVFIGFLAYRESREATRRWRLAQRISRIGRSPHHLLTENDFRERRR